MTPKRDPSKALQLGFVALLVVSIAQVAWWMTDYVLYARDVERRLAAQYDAEAAAANALLARGMSPEALAPLLPNTEIGSGAATVRASALEELAAERARITTRVLWEGRLFLVVPIAGLAVLARAIRLDWGVRH